MPAIAYRKPLKMADPVKVKAVKIRVGASGRVWATTPKSKGGQGVWYELKTDKKGRVYCMCPAWRYSAPKKEDKNCKHIEAAVAQEVWKKGALEGR